MQLFKKIMMYQMVFFGMLLVSGIANAFNAYVVNGSNNMSAASVSMYSVNPDTGLLKPLTPESVATGYWPTTITFDPSKRYAYVTNTGAGSVSMYSVNQDGTLKDMGTVATGGRYPDELTFDRSGKYVYVTNQSRPGSISMYSIESNGILKPLNPATISTENVPRGFKIHPSGRFAYIANWKSNSISMYGVESNGMLKSLSPATVQTGSDPLGLTFDPAGKYAYVTNCAENTISMYIVETNGILKPLSRVATGIDPGPLNFDKSGKYAYVVNQGRFPGRGSISMYGLESNGILKPLSPATVQADTEPRGFTFDLSGKYAYVTNSWGNSISMYEIDPLTGTLKFNSTTNRIGGTAWVTTFDPSGRFAYTVSLDRKIAVYSLNSDGTLKFQGTVPTGPGSEWIVFN